MLWFLDQNLITYVYNIVFQNSICSDIPIHISLLGIIWVFIYITLDQKINEI